MKKIESALCWRGASLSARKRVIQMVILTSVEREASLLYKSDKMQTNARRVLQFCESRQQNVKPFAHVAARR